MQHTWEGAPATMDSYHGLACRAAWYDAPCSVHFGRNCLVRPIRPLEMERRGNADGEQESGEMLEVSSAFSILCTAFGVDGTA